MHTKLLAMAILIISSSLAEAQLSGNAFLGYSLDNVSSSALAIVNGNRSGLSGWNASVEVKVFRWVGAVADFSGHYGSGRQSFTQPTVFFDYDTREHDFLFGPRVSTTFGRVRPFAEGLAGVGLMGGKADDIPVSQTSFAFAFGGGIDYNVARILGLRAQGDYVRTTFFNSPFNSPPFSTAQNDFRLSTGLVLRF